MLRGTVINHGPLNNHGIVNFRNLSPFGPNETVIEALDRAHGEQGRWCNKSDTDRWGPSTRGTSTLARASAMSASCSPTAAPKQTAPGILERLRYNDFYGAVGFKGVNSDLTISAVHFRQRDNYDEANLER